MMNLRSNIYGVGEKMKKNFRKLKKVKSEIGYLQQREEIIRVDKKLEEMKTQLEEEIQKREKAEETMNVKSKSLWIMSHEMRTPLNGIIGFIQMLGMESLSDSQAETLSIIKNLSKILLSLINDTLDCAKYEADKMNFEAIEFNLEKVVRNAVEPFRAMTQNKGLKFNLKFGGKINYRVVSDPIKLTQVLNNLLNNALKFTVQGSIEVFVNTELVEDKVVVTIEVKDTGIGIRDEVKPYLFTPFTQAESKIVREYGGTGLGLTICKEIISHYGGKISFTSKFNEGTIFMVTMPIDIALGLHKVEVDSDLKQLKKSNIQAAKSIGRVLVAEDNYVNQKLMKKFLERYNVIFDMASNGKEAVELTKINEYDIIFMDCQMPVLDGFEATKQIRDIVGEQIPIIAMTAYDSYEDKEKCFSAGMNKFLTKPINLHDLAKILDIEAEFLEDILEDKKMINKEVDYKEKAAKNLMKIIGFDFETCMELIVTYVDQANNGFKEIDELIKDDNYKEVTKLLHQLKGASATVRLEVIRLNLEKAEKLLEQNNVLSVLEIIERVRGEAIFK